MFPHHLSLMPFSALKQIVKETVIGQDDMVDAVVLSIYKHLLKLSGVSQSYFPNKASNLLIIGKTGTGKTLSVKEVARLTKIPFVEIDSSAISMEGYKGASLRDMLSDGLKSCENTESRNYPIIFLDEFDKLCTPDPQDHNKRTQYSILKVIDGITIDIRGNFYDTQNFCFVFAGAFTDLWGNKETKPTTIGFVEQKDEQDQVEISSCDLEEFGMVPELAGRINKTIKANDFTTEMYYKLGYNKNAIANKWREYLKLLGISSFPEFNIVALVAEAEKRGLGGRGLNQLMEKEVDRILNDNFNLIDFNKAWDDQFPVYKRIIRED